MKSDAAFWYRAGNQSIQMRPLLFYVVQQALALLYLMKVMPIKWFSVWECGPIISRTHRSKGRLGESGAGWGEGHDMNICTATMADRRRAGPVGRGGAARCYAKGNHCNLSPLSLSFLSTNAGRKKTKKPNPVRTASHLLRLEELFHKDPADVFCQQAVFPLPTLRSNKLLCLNMCLFYDWAVSLSDSDCWRMGAHEAERRLTIRKKRKEKKKDKSRRLFLTLTSHS